MTLTKATFSMVLGAPVSILDYGADPTGASDSSGAISAAIAAVKSSGYGGEIWFPKGKYRINSTIEAADLRGVRFVGSMGTINTNPTVADGADDSVLFWGGSTTSTEPMFYFARGHNNTFEHLCLQGNTGSDVVGGPQAFAGVWIDENHENYRFYDCKIFGFGIGIRVCSGYDYDTGTWNAGLARYSGYYSAAANAVGGFASDNGSYINCSLSYNTIAGLSIESAQALDMHSMKCVFLSNNNALLIWACQGITVDTPTFLASTSHDIYVNPKSSVGNIRVLNSHTEGGAANFLHLTGLGVDVGKGNWLQNAAGGLVYSECSGTLTIDNSILAGVSMAGENSLVIRNSKVTTLDKTLASGQGGLLQLENVTVLSAVTNNWSNYSSTVVLESVIPGLPMLAVIPLSIASADQYGAQIQIGGSLGSGYNGVSGTTILSPNSDSAQVCYGCYYDASGTLIASNTQGGVLTLNATGAQIRVFTGATVGTTPSLVAGTYT